MENRITYQLLQVRKQRQLEKREKALERQEKTKEERTKAFIQEIKDQDELEARRKKARDDHKRKKKERDRRER